MINLLNGYIIFCLLITIAYLVGLLTFFGENDGIKCDMTYMFEMPQYIKIDNAYDKHFPKYGLYYYEEGRPRKTSPSFWGVPVIFVPGNAGSYKQVRSLASVALRKSVNGRKPYHFDYFTIDLNEELTGLSGIYLNDQLKYVNKSIYTVLDLYPNKKFKPKAVILIGHSMGGLLVRKLAQFNSTPINIVITLSSPHRRSPVILDLHMDQFYNSLDHPINPNITFINLSGGYKDWLVPTTLTDLRDNTSLYTLTTNIPRSWAMADHKSILWCKQTVVTLTRALFDCVDFKSRQVDESNAYRKSVFHHHLLQHPGTLVRLKDKYLHQSNFPVDNSEWIETLGRQYTISLLKGTSNTKYYMIKLTNDPKHEMLTVIALNLESTDWLYICGAHIPKATYKVCEFGNHLTQLSWIAPSSRYKRKMVTLNLHQLKVNYSLEQYTHVIFKSAATDDPVVFYVDIHAQSNRILDFTVPKLWDLNTKTLIGLTEKQALRYEITLRGLTHVIQSYNLWINPKKCVSDVYHTTATLHVPWGNEDVSKFFTETDKKSFNVRLYNSKPKHSRESAILKLTLDPMCQYQIRLQTSVTGTLGQLARFYTPLLVVNIAAIVLLIIKSQLHSLNASGDCHSFFLSLKIGTKPYYVLALTNMITHIFDLFDRWPSWKDWSILREEGVDFFLLPYIMYLIGVGSIWIIALLIGIWITICESTIHKIFLKFINKTMPFTFIWSENMITALQQIPCAVALAIIIIGCCTCGALALVLGTVFYFLKLTQMSQDYLEEVAYVVLKKIALKLKIKGWKKKGHENKNNKSGITSLEKLEESSRETVDKTHNDDIDTSPVAFHGAIFLLFLIASLINLPSVVSWAHNYRYASGLRPDPSFITGMVFSVCALPLWYYNIPFKKLNWYNEVGHLTGFGALFILIFAPIHLYRLNYVLSAVMSVLVLHQLLASNKVEQDVTDNNKEDNILETYNQLKSKLE